MNKGYLIEAVAARLGNRRDAANAVDAVLDAIVRTVLSGEKVSVTGFGVLEIVDRPTTTARNPATGEAVIIEAHKAIRFRPAQAFKDMLNGTRELPERSPAIRKAPKTMRVKDAA